MSKSFIGLLLAAVIAGNIITCVLTLGLRDASPWGGASTEVDTVAAAVDSLGAELSQLSDALRSHIASSSPSDAERDSDDSKGDALSARIGDLFKRLDRIQKSLDHQVEVRNTSAAIELREKRQALFRADDGHLFAEELLSDKKFALGANGMLTFLEEHPDHPDTQDLMRRAREGFRESGYLDKALWLQQEIMKKFPEHRGADLHILSMMERRMKNYDSALRHIDGSLRLAATDKDRINRLYYRAELVHEIDGDRAGLEAYREVQSQAAAVGIGPITHAARKRADRIEERLSR